METSALRTFHPRTTWQTFSRSLYPVPHSSAFVTSLVFASSRRSIRGGVLHIYLPIHLFVPIVPILFLKTLPRFSPTFLSSHFLFSYLSGFELRRSIGLYTSITRLSTYTRDLRYTRACNVVSSLSRTVVLTEVSSVFHYIFTYTHITYSLTV